mmetsp:Transcript_144936/g.464490  ORF Transcript_144936/g.464490 Transcript_144936/m.464490 type:complete len:285 (+) Transcript_144936:905-1759(+)
MRLGVVVASLHELENLVVGTAAVAEIIAVVAGLQLDDPDALAGGAAVLLDDARLERHGLLEALVERLLGVVRQCVGQADFQVRDLAQGILRAHVHHDVRRRPDLKALLLQSPHAVVELHLVAAAGVDLARVATHDDGVEALEHLEEGVVLRGHVVQQLAAHARRDHAVGDREAVVAVAARALVRAAEGLRGHVELHQSRLVLGIQGLGEQADVVRLRDLREARDIHQGRLRAAARQQRARRTGAGGHRGARGERTRPHGLPHGEGGGAAAEPPQGAKGGPEHHG